MRNKIEKIWDEIIVDNVIFPILEIDNTEIYYIDVDEMIRERYHIEKTNIIGIFVWETRNGELKYKLHTVGMLFNWDDENALKNEFFSILLED